MRLKYEPYNPASHARKRCLSVVLHGDAAFSGQVPTILICMPATCVVYSLHVLYIQYMCCIFILYLLYALYIGYMYYVFATCVIHSASRSCSTGTPSPAWWRKHDLCFRQGGVYATLQLSGIKGFTTFSIIIYIPVYSYPACGGSISYTARVCRMHSFHIVVAQV